MYGNAGLTARWLADVSDYPNSRDFNIFPAEIKPRIEERVLPSIADAGQVGVRCAIYGLC